MTNTTLTRMPESLRLGVVLEALLARPFPDVLDWLVSRAPTITDLEIGSGGYAPHPHCDRDRLLRESAFRSDWQHEITRRGLRIGRTRIDRKAGRARPGHARQQRAIARP